MNPKSSQTHSFLLVNSQGVIDVLLPVVQMDINHLSISDSLEATPLELTLPSSTSECPSGYKANTTE